MHFVKSVALATLVLCTIVELSKEVKTKLVIYVDVKNGTLEMQLLGKKVALPCANLEQAITGAGKTHNFTIHVLPFEVSLVAFQNVQPYILVHFGSSLSHLTCGKNIHVVVKCNETVCHTGLLLHDIQ